MRYIILSLDAQPILYEAPDSVAETLADLANQFLCEVNSMDSSHWRLVTDPSGAQYQSLAFTLDDFVAWLNRFPETRHQPVRQPEHMHMEEREIIMDTALRERNRPVKQQQYPWVNL